MGSCPKISGPLSKAPSLNASHVDLEAEKTEVAAFLTEFQPHS